jgi:hypothetical protein
MMFEENPALAEAARQDRPFPWHCPRCRQQAVERVTIPYQCERRHGDRRVTIALDALAVPQCAECGELVFDYLAEEQINDALRVCVN